MRRSLTFLLAACLLLAVGGCNDRTDDSEGSVILSVTDFDGLPTAASVNALGNPGSSLILEQVVIDNLPKDPGGGTSDLMNVEMQTYEVVYQRVDTGTRTPGPLVRSIFGVAPVGGQITYENLPIMSSEQLLNPPLSDLLVENGGIDSETGSPQIVINFRVRFFGRTIAGDSVATAPIRFDVEFVP